MPSATVALRGRLLFAQLQGTSDVNHVERVMAVARVALCAACLLPAIAGALASETYSHAATLLLLLYSIQAAGVWMALRFVRVHGAAPGRILHTLDFGWAAALTLVTAGPSNPFFVLFLFVILSAAFRWRLSETVITGVSALAAIVLQRAMTSVAPPSGLELSIQLAYVGVATVLLGLLAEDEKLRRAQVASAGDLLAGVLAQPGFRAALRYVASALLRATASETLLVAAREFDSNRAVLWMARRAGTGGMELFTRELSEEARRLYFFRGAGDAWIFVRRRDDTCAIRAIDAEGDTIGGVECELADTFWRTHPSRSALAVALGFGEEWRARVFLLRQRRYHMRDLRFAHRVLRQVAPSMYNQYLLRRLRSRVVAAERRRVARELHDGVIQSLIGLEMQTAALRLQVAARDPHLDAQLQCIQQVLRDEAAAVRDVMQQIRPFEAGPGEFVPALADVVARFERDTGVRARLDAAPPDAYVPSRAARELGRTLQEALANVRRHSGARRVDVEFRAAPDAWRLVIENDGRPFGFTGRLRLDELEAQRLGPRVIKERVREMGGDLVIESDPASGVRLEISLPRPEGQSKSA
jgi:signal transduction histidine kinase